MLAQALALLVVQAGAPGPGGLDLRLSASAGVGHDSNLSHDASTTAAVGSDLAVASASAGVLRDGEAGFLGADLLADATDTRDVPDLSEVRAGGDVVLGIWPWERAGLTATGTATRSWWRDAARDGWGFSALASVRVRPLPRLTLVGHGGRTWYEADDPVYSFVADRVGVRAEVRVARRAWLRAGYTWGWRDEVFYVPVGAAARLDGRTLAADLGDGAGPGGPGGGGSGSGRGTRRTQGGPPITGSFPGGDRLVVKSASRVETARGGLELPLFLGVYLDVDVSRVHVTAELDAYEAWVGLALLGFRN